MKYSLPFRILLIFCAFGGIYYFWYKNQSTSLSFNVPSLLETKEDTSLASFGGSYEEDTLDIATTSPSISDNSSVDTVTLVDTTIVKEDTVITSLKSSFSKKYNKDVSNISVFIENLQAPFIKGSVDFDNSGYTATFYAYKSLENGNWEIVAVENGVVACTIIDPYSFPSNIIPQCYSYSSGTVVNR